VKVELVFIQFEQPALFDQNFLKMRSLDGKSAWEVYMGSMHAPRRFLLLPNMES
jgi:hypothetical protein